MRPVVSVRAWIASINPPPEFFRRDPARNVLRRHVFLPALASMMEGLSPVLLKISEFAQNHETLVKVVGFTAVALLAMRLCSFS